MVERLRPADEGDCGTLAALDARLNPSPWTERSFREALAGAQVRIAEDAAGTPCGFVVFTLVAEHCEIQNIGVAVERQRSGLGRRLLEIALTTARRAGARRCLLEVRESNHAARALYAGCGFTVDGRRKGYYGGGREDALLMSLELC
jgi:ribosomal-protein-alanine N-acetyltransferase